MYLSIYSVSCGLHNPVMNLIEKHITYSQALREKKSYHLQPLKQT